MLPDEPIPPSDSDISAASAESPNPHPFGAFAVNRSPHELSLRLENRGELTIQGCFVFFFIMSCILVLGVLSVVDSAQPSALKSGPHSATQIFAPTPNYLWFLWAASLALLFVAVPLYVIRTYRSALVFRFDRRDGVFYRGKQRVCRLQRIEYIRISEEKDPDEKFLYFLRIVHSDGQEMLLHNGYSEREALNLANALSAFLETTTKWK